MAISHLRHPAYLATAHMHGRHANAPDADCTLCCRITRCPACEEGAHDAHEAEFYRLGYGTDHCRCSCEAIANRKATARFQTPHGDANFPG